MERSRLVERMQQDLERRGWPRIELLLVVALAGVTGFLVSYALLTVGVMSMPVRYGIAGLVGYLAFLCGIGIWIAWKRGARPDLDGLDLLQVPEPVSLTSGAAGPGEPPFHGGRSGGGGASDSWEGRDVGHRSSAEGPWFDPDVDFGWVLVVIVVALSGVLAVGYVVYLAPVLLAEVLVDAVIVAAVSRRVRGMEKRDWTATVVRRTWLAALTVVLMLVIAGWALQKLAPGARSIGPAVEEILGTSRRER